MDGWNCVRMLADNGIDMDGLDILILVLGVISLYGLIGLFFKVGDDVVKDRGFLRVLSVFMALSILYLIGLVAVIVAAGVADVLGILGV